MALYPQEARQEAAGTNCARNFEAEGQRMSRRAAVVMDSVDAAKLVFVYERSVPDASLALKEHPKVA